mgnify:CR=1 FL=1
MATLTDNETQIKNEFHSLQQFYDKLCQLPFAHCQLAILSMGMSSDYKIAIEEGSNLIRVGSLIFESRT